MEIFNMKLISILIVSILCCGCGQIKFLVTGVPADYKPDTPLTATEWQAVNGIEGRVPAAAQKFGFPNFKVYRPRITVVRNPDQVVRGFNLPWQDVPKIPGYAPAQFPAEGYSGLYRGPDLYVSRVTWRDNDMVFRDLYAHERTHSFFQPGTGHASLFWQIKKFLLDEE